MTSQKFKLLVVDDDELVIESIGMAIPENWQMTGVYSKNDIPKNEFFHAAFIDMHLSGDLDKPEGLSVIKHLSREQKNLEIIAFSGDLNRNLMEDCLKAGASRFLAKPLSTEEIRLVLEKIEALFLFNDASIRGRKKLTHQWIGSSQASQNIKRLVSEMSLESGPILIEGESGTGKEVVASLLHSSKPTAPFISVNIAALPETLFESEVFGHVKGAFTGAEQNKMGLAEAANGGDLFLDEIEALPMNLQAKLLRFLENGEIKRLGAKENIKLNVRIIAATNKNLEKMVKDGTFREDLMWRLNGKKILLPPLRERKEDIEELCKYYLQKERPQKNKTLAPEALERFQKYDWPGNIRELKRTLEHLCFSSPLPIIRLEDINKIFNNHTTSIENGSLDLSLGLQKLLAQYEKKIIANLLSENQDIDLAAKVLQISRSSLYKKISDHNIEVKK